MESPVDWGAWIPWADVCARATGRRYYNVVRRERAEARRYEVANLYLPLRGRRGCQAEIARRVCRKRPPVAKRRRFELRLGRIRPLGCRRSSVTRRVRHGADELFQFVDLHVDPVAELGPLAGVRLFQCS